MDATHALLHGRSNGLLVFDIETNGLPIEGAEGEGMLMPDITCVVTMQLIANGRGKYHAEEAMYWHEDLNGGEFMLKEKLSSLVAFMRSMDEQGLVPFSWNGAGFDFKVLHALALKYELPREAEHIKGLALAGVDPMLNFFMHQGFPVGLKSVATAFELPMNKTGTGEDAIVMWVEGGPTGRQEVVNYCENDVGVLAMAASAICAHRKIMWTTKKSNQQKTWQPNNQCHLFMTTKQAMRIKPPNPNWMTGPRLTSENFIGWLK